ncbi:hypothetical protein ACFCYB_23270 [Streptomyces sp. NPDC056309]|uniref:hypothetical protein n=1 Tax=unclassified Streptomyces TaxID=2593676 RepID=UPI0035D7E52F
MWIDVPLDGAINSGIRAKGEGTSSEGARRLRERRMRVLRFCRRQRPLGVIRSC